MDQLIENIQQARAAAPECCKDGFLDLAMQVFMGTKSWCIAKLGENQSNASANIAFTTVDSSEISLDTLFMDDLWLKEGFAFSSVDLNLP